MDFDGSGLVDEEEFKSVLATMIEVKRVEGVSEQDINDLFQSFARGSPMVHYKDVLSSFRVVSSE